MFYANKTQKLAAEILEKHLARGQVSQAYFFTGDEVNVDPETGLSRKEEFLLNFCLRLVGGAAEEQNRRRRIVEDKHPDVLRLGVDPDLTSIKVEAMRKLLAWTNLKPFEGERRVGMICRAEKLTDEAANIFLKTLEEAPGNTVFCLLSSSRDLVMETIRSRCFEVRFPDLASSATAWTQPALPPFAEMIDKYSDLTKQELKPALDSLLENIRFRMLKATSEGAALAKPYLEAFEKIRDTKASLEMNANSKLAVTNMIMQLRRIFPGQRGIA